MNYSYPQAQAQAMAYRPAPSIADDYERWYTEATPSNRMLLSLRSGIDSEITWALDRLCRLCDNEQFVLRAIPGLIEALFEWPEWYVKENSTEQPDIVGLFSASPKLETKRRHSLESLFILRNAVVNQSNAAELAAHPRTRPLIFSALHNLKGATDQHAEFLLHTIELLHAVTSTSTSTSRSASLPWRTNQNPIPPLAEIADRSSDRSLATVSLETLALLLSNHSNAPSVSASSPALTASLRYLPMFVFNERLLTEACLNYFYAHLSYTPMTKAFLLHPDMSSTLKMLTCLLLSEQVDEKIVVDLGSPAVAPPPPVTSRYRQFKPEELEALAPIQEPQRCSEWMKLQFVPKPTGEVTQVEFWNLYKDAFEPYKDQYQLLAASDVIKGVTSVYPETQALVLPGPPQKFVVRGVDRRREERFPCQWDKSQCREGPFESQKALFEHVSEHINTHADEQLACHWASCPYPAASKRTLLSHVSTHLQSLPPPAPGATIVLHPTGNGSAARNTSVSYSKVIVNPSPTVLTALLCIRILFHASFASANAAPRVDGDHFGFPGIVEEAEDQEVVVGLDESELEGERRGRKAFATVRYLMERVHIKDDVLMVWITEMADAGMIGAL